MTTITFTWSDPSHTILVCTYPGPGWTWTDLIAAFKQQHDLINEAGHPVYVIVDTRKSNWIPSGGSWLGLVKNFGVVRHPNQRDTVIVGAHGFLVTMLQALMRLRNEALRDFHLVDTLDEAYALFERLVDYRSRAAG